MKLRPRPHGAGGVGMRARELRRRVPYSNARAALIAMSTSIAAMHTAYAADEPASGSRTNATSTLPSVTVSASKGTSLDDMDLSTTALSRKQVQQAPQTTVDQIVNKIPGVYTPQVSTFALHPTSSIVGIRGFGNAFGTKTLVLVDGVPINDGYFRTVDWSIVPKGRVDQIEVIRGGGATSLWGNLAMGGVIDIITKEPQPGEKTLDVSYGSYNTRTADAAITLLSTPVLTVGLTANTYHTDGYNLTPEQYRNASNVATSGFANNVALSFYLTPDAASKYYLQVYEHDKHEDGLVYANAKNTWERYGLRAGATRKLDDGSSLNADAWVDRTNYFTRNASQTGGYSLSTPTLGYSYVSQIESAPYKTAGGSVYWQKDIGPIHDLKVGVDYRYLGVDDQNNLYNVAGTNTSTFTVHGQHQFFGVFSQGTYRPQSIPLDITLGLRGDYWRANNASIAGQSLAGSLNQQLNDASKFTFNPRLGAKYYFDNGLDVRAAVYRNFSAPGMNQMYRAYVSGGTYNSTNPNLVPETNVGEEIGFDLKKSLYNVSFTAFHNRVSNYIDYPTLCSTAASCAGILAGTGLSSITSVRQYQNVGKATIMGAELFGDVKVTPTLTLNSGLTYTEAYLTESNTPLTSPTHNQLGQVPHWVWTGGASWEAIPALTLTAQVKAWTGYWYNTAHTVRNGGAAIIDLGASYQINKTVQVYGLIQNLGGHLYYDTGAQGTTTPPQYGQPFSVYGGLRITL
ncbi:TonB-dependent receptor [Caballeronia sp. LZ033]|uniref:TonB-dependent receptor plug domain-containing protein n=1 Tax=Caballeronia sp. LZ033 TaxID=3038566 RepID=UPI00285DE375|nr:TonB-dependent receptor [Caballeronia sp. LZ033]MDR5818752.1 TonB-dependent receptor [Caballeronia sp. LZ033]